MFRIRIRENYEPHVVELLDRSSVRQTREDLEAGRDASVSGALPQPFCFEITLPDGRELEVLGDQDTFDDLIEAAEHIAAKTQDSPQKRARIWTSVVEHASAYGIVDDDEYATWLMEDEDEQGRGSNPSARHEH